MPTGSPFAELPGGLPPGAVLETDQDYFDDETWAGRDVLWVSDERLPDAAAHWLRLYERRAETGLYPLLLDTLGGDDARPWHSREFSPAPVGTIDVLSAAGVLRRFWDEVAAEPEEDEDADIPTGAWPGLAAPGEDGRDPDAVARGLATSLGESRSWLLGLVPAGRGADTLTLAGWDGPVNHTGYTQELSAVVRSWEERFGARVVAVGFDTLDLSVAAPPVTFEHALNVAAEHHAFCPDNVWQGSGSLEEYAKGLVGADRWTFWWD
ncbi:DUF4253 domain-containing protein [Actinomadura rugatobispora]|uniref:DUF4253 domain-containing protein n=1 Tax=Actinomadura rugatobispora TaxID=1994 RepID=A0ABW0ZQ56_9ACTN